MPVSCLLTIEGPSAVTIQTQCVRACAVAEARRMSVTVVLKQICC